MKIELVHDFTTQRNLLFISVYNHPGFMYTHTHTHTHTHIYIYTHTHTYCMADHIGV